MIRRAFWRIADSLRDTRGTGGTSLRQQRVHLLTAISQCRSNQDAVQMKKCVEGKSGPLSLLGFEACCFFRFRWAWTSFLYAYVQEVGFPTPCTCISKPTFLFLSKDRMVIFLQSRNPTFLYLWPFEDASAALQLSSTKTPVSWRQSIAHT